MKKIIPFKQTIDLENSVSEINSISLEHTLHLEKESLITGTFIISGEYKMTEASVNLDPFTYELPFEISIDSKYDTKNIKVDINDFYYELVNSKNLLVNIEVSIDNLEVLEREVVETIKDTKETNEIKEEKNIKSVFDSIEEAENYEVYKVHIIAENDTIESIMQKYAITKESLESYNDLNNIKLGDKLIIPSNGQN